MVSKYFTGVALELNPAKDFKLKDEVQQLSLSMLWDKITGLKKSMGHILLVSLIIQVFAIISPLSMQIVVDNVLLNANQSLLKSVVFGFFIVGVFNILSTVFRSYLILYFGNILSVQMRSNLFRHLLRLPLPFFEKRHIGDVSSRFGSLGQIQAALTSGLVESLVDGVMVLITLVMMLLYSVKLTMIVIVAVILYGLLRLFSYSYLNKP